MAKKKKTYDSVDIPDYQLESLARVLLPMMRDYLSSEEGQKDYEEWQAKKQNPQLNNNSKMKEEPH